MGILKRLKNLWKLSEYEPLNNGTAPTKDQEISSLVKPKQPAIVVDMYDPIRDTDLGDE